VIVALDGPDGAGKSTQVRRLIEWANGNGRTAAVVGKWDIFRSGVVPQARFLRGSDQHDLRVCIAEMPLPARMLFLGWMNTTAATRAVETDADLVILDGYWAKHAATELLAGCDRRLVDAITSAIAPVDVVVYMDITPEEALRRKGTDLTPYECGRDPGCSPENFLRHQGVVRDLMLEWAGEYGWAVVRADSVDGTQEQLQRIVAEAMAAPRLVRQ
jgi:dTMP kinase